MKCKNLRIIITILLGTFIMTGCSFTKKTSIPKSNKYQTKVNSVVYTSLNNKQKNIYIALMEGMCDIQKEIKVLGNLNDIKIAYEAIEADHPEIFYVDGYVYNEKNTIIGNKTNNIIIFPNYTCKKEEINILKNQFNNIQKSFLRKIDITKTEYEKSKQIYELLVNEFSYDKDSNAGKNVFAAFLKKKTGSKGYAKAYTYLMQKAGIPCANVSGKYNNGTYTWNVSIINKKMYLSDVTNGDSSLVSSTGKQISNVNYEYFNMNPAFAKRYITKEILTDIVFKSMEANYYVKNGTYFSDYNKDNIEKAILNAKNKGDKEISLSFGTVDTLRYVKNFFFDNKHIQDILGDSKLNYSVDENVNTLTILF